MLTISLPTSYDYYGPIYGKRVYVAAPYPNTLDEAIAVVAMVGVTGVHSDVSRSHHWKLTDRDGFVLAIIQSPAEA